jgi:hypothetical protein
VENYADQQASVIADDGSVLDPNGTTTEALGVPEDLAPIRGQLWNFRDDWTSFNFGRSCQLGGRH